MLPISSAMDAHYDDLSLSLSLSKGLAKTVCTIEQHQINHSPKRHTSLVGPHSTAVVLIFVCHSKYAQSLIPLIAIKQLHCVCVMNTTAMIMVM